MPAGWLRALTSWDFINNTRYKHTMLPTVQNYHNGNQFSYRPTLLNAPDLPSWINYVYSTRHQTGFLYGVPPQLLHITGIELEIIGLNKESYETRRRVVPMNIEEKPDAARFEVQLKIHNLNVEDLFDTQRLSRLLDVFRSRLWPGSRDDLHVTMLASAVRLGARLPLRPTEREGVVLRLGSASDFSPALRELQEEVKPLWKMGSSCPRDFKRTSVERLFREQGFALDWCSFRLFEAEELQLHATADSAPTPMPPMKHPTDQAHIWHAPPARANVPQRSYAHEFVVTILVPMLVLLLLVMLLSLILCFHHEGIFQQNKQGRVARYKLILQRWIMYQTNTLTRYLISVRTIGGKRATKQVLKSLAYTNITNLDRNSNIVCCFL
ncbi:hypothetical protein B566_EDAN014682 [Ephemera danica]|nr:hypothetical protein B566_EDAN014682 [Ephemera danica]